MLLRILWLTPLLLLLIPIANAQPPQKEDALFRTIATMDGALFDAYNRCELEKFSAFFTDDVEFYHDQGGVTLGRKKLTESVQKNICGKVRRELVPGKLEVFPMRGFGAVEIGVHRFYQKNETTPSGEAKFIHLWKLEGSAWKITRVISFDHGAIPK